MRPAAARECRMRWVIFLARKIFAADKPDARRQELSFIGVHLRPSAAKALFLEVEIASEQHRAGAQGTRDVAEVGRRCTEISDREEGVVQEVRRLTPESQSVALFKFELLLQREVQVVSGL